MISIVIPLYNKEKVIKKTLDTVLAQSFSDYEIIIVDDGSTDKSVSVVEEWMQYNKYIPLKIRMIHQENSGVSVARNTGIKYSIGDYVAFLDADDEWHEDFLRDINDLICKYSNCDVFASAYAYKQNGEIINIDFSRLGIVGDTGIVKEYFRKAAKMQPPLWTSAIVVSKKALLRVEGFPIGVTIGQDLLTWAKLASLYNIAYTKKVRSFYIRDSIAYETVGKGYQKVPSPRDDRGGELLQSLKKIYHPIGIDDYIFLWHKMRLVMFVSSYRRKDAFGEWLKCFPKNLLSLDCYYWIILNSLPKIVQLFIRKHIKK